MTDPNAPSPLLQPPPSSTPTPADSPKSDVPSAPRFTQGYLPGTDLTDAWGAKQATIRRSQSWLPIAAVYLFVIAALGGLYLLTTYSRAQQTPLSAAEVGPGLNFELFYIVLFVVIGALAAGVAILIWLRKGQQEANRQAAEQAALAAQAPDLQMTSLDAAWQFWQAELIKATNRAVVDLAGDTAAIAQVNDWRAQAQTILNDLAAGKPIDWSALQFYIMSIRQTAWSADAERREDNIRLALGTLIICIYIGVVISIFFAPQTSDAETIPIFNIPLGILMWGAAGSLASILYRFYTQTARIPFAVELRWLIARPIIGILMSGVVYLALQAGLFLFSGQTATLTGVQDKQFAVYAVAAFLAGFSDKFFEQLLTRLTGSISVTADDGSNKPTQSPAG